MAYDQAAANHPFVLRIPFHGLAGYKTLSNLDEHGAELYSLTDIAYIDSIEKSRRLQKDL